MDAHAAIVCQIANKVNDIFSIWEFVAKVAIWQSVTMKNFEKYLDFAKSLTEGEQRRFRTKAELAEFVGIAPSQVKKYSTAEDMKNIEKFFSYLDKLGVELTFSPAAEPDKDVCFVNARVVPAGEGVEPPQAEDYIAAPLVGEVGAGPGYIPQDEVKSWFLAYRHLPAVRHRRNLLAVELGKSSDSMMPTLNPGDIVLVDRDDRNVEHPGRMMLVLDPDGAGMIKRVSVREEGNDFRITFYSDNAIKHPPMVYSLREDYLNDWDRAIAGRAIWAWSDIREK